MPSIITRGTMSAKAFGFAANRLPSLYTANINESTVSKIGLLTGSVNDPWAMLAVVG